MSGVQSEAIAAIRGFNRFYTRELGLLDRGLLDSDFTLTEARVLFELASHDGMTAKAIAAELGLDAGYLSRILKRFDRLALIERSASRRDGRETLLRLTEGGRSAFAPLEAASKAQVAAMLGKLSPGDRRILVRTLERARSLLAGREEPAAPVLLRRHRVGDLGWIAHRQGRLYHEEYGWDETYEALVAEILTGFVRGHDPRRERAFVAERRGSIVGSAFLMCENDETARLRLLYVEPEMRGSGLGGRLVGECIAFARDHGYDRLTLWTNSNLDAARRIYEREGFRLVAEKPHRSFGRDLVGQDWMLDL
jgi:DNA-binding MarR family transcriptional regulator/GNAT superfamily N-acetyltransferase